MKMKYAPKVAWMLAAILAMQGIAPAAYAEEEAVERMKAVLQEATASNAKRLNASESNILITENPDGDADILEDQYEDEYELAKDNEEQIEDDQEEEEPGDEKEQEDEKELEDDRTGTDEVKVATSSNAQKQETADIFADMPEIGSEAFTEWFFLHTDSEELWDWVFAVMDGETEESSEAFMEWYALHEEEVIAKYNAHSGIMTMSSSTGDLWDGWVGNMDWIGDGTESNPYEISTIADLMGLSEACSAGSSMNGKYFRLMNDIDLSDLTYHGGNWNPIGWYQNHADFSNAVKYPFKGHFDGDGNTISGLKISPDTAYAVNNVGLFGVIENGTVKNLNIECSGTGVYGADNVGILAGSLKGDTKIFNVSVSGYVHADADAGGIAGEVTGSSDHEVTIENCSAEDVAVNAADNTGYAGGIAGNVQYAYLVDNKVQTGNGSSDRIQGKGYVGGIAGRINKAYLYNNYVNGTIGGNGSKAVGGMIGRYVTGDLIVAVFDGAIGATNLSDAAHEGTFIGTRETQYNFHLTTDGATNNVAYLYTKESNKNKVMCGSQVDSDNKYTDQAHIGYWVSNKQKYITRNGTNEIASGDRYFYEELEDGIRYIVTQQLGKEFTWDGYFAGLDFKLDHYAPGYMGQPTRGYLVSIPRIDAVNANGTMDSDVATLIAMPDTNNSYYRTITKENALAVAPEAVVRVTTSANNKTSARYQMVVDANEPGGVKPPTYTYDEDEVTGMGGIFDMTYLNGGGYSFEMPNADTELNVEYIKVTTQIGMTPANTHIDVVQTRSGDRKNPDIRTEVKNADGTLIARYINGVMDKSVEVQPVKVHAESNGAGETSDRTVKWSVDDTDLIINQSEAGWTMKDAVIMPNLESDFISEIINREVAAQADGGYQEKINNTVYTRTAVVTASTNMDTSVDNKPVYGNCSVDVNFQIIDNTTLRVEALNLNKTNISFKVTRKLTGDRKNPVETYSCTEPVILSASLNPEQPFYKNVSWKDVEAGKAIMLQASGDNKQDCKVAVNYSTTGTDNPAWIQNIINQDNDLRKADNYKKLSGSGTYTETVTATSEDQTNGNIKNTCDVTILFETVDETVIHPERVEMSQKSVTYDLSYKMEGDNQSRILSKDGFTATDLDATAIPDCDADSIHEPYNRNVVWSVSDPDAVRVDENGVITPNPDAAWIRNARVKAPYAASKIVEVYAAAEDDYNQAKGVTTVTLNYVTKCVELDQEQMNYDLKNIMQGDSRSLIAASTGFDEKTLQVKVYPEQKNVVWRSSEPDAVSVDADGRLTVNPDAAWIKEARKTAPYEADKVVEITASYDGITDRCLLNLKYQSDCVEFPKEALQFDLKLVKSGYRSSPSYSWSGADGISMKAAAYPGTDKKLQYQSGNAGILKIDANGMVSPVADPALEWMKSAMASPWTAQVNTSVQVTDGTSTDTCPVKLTITVTDNTYAGSSGGGGGSSSGGGGGSSSGVTAGGKTTAAFGPSGNIPSYVVTGTWIQNAAGKWLFHDESRTYADEWAAVHNPYAKTELGQPLFDWFHFDKDGFMQTGWFTDKDESVYYLNENSDGTKGAMFTGWHWINGKCYYFNTQSDGTRGKLLKNTTTPDGYTVNENGEWTVDGVVQVK